MNLCCSDLWVSCFLCPPLHPSEAVGRTGPLHWASPTPRDCMCRQEASLRKAPPAPALLQTLSPWHIPRPGWTPGAGRTHCSRQTLWRRCSPSAGQPTGTRWTPRATPVFWLPAPHETLPEPWHIDQLLFQDLVSNSVPKPQSKVRLYNCLSRTQNVPF